MEKQKMNTPSQNTLMRDSGWLSQRFMLPIFAFTLISLGSMLAQANSSAPAAATPQKAAVAKHNATDAGERVFQANCSRCHNPPEQLSPRIVGTIALHMRVRANLSAQDERDILKFLAP
jgi:cytochrome c5